LVIIAIGYLPTGVLLPNVGENGLDSIGDKERNRGFGKEKNV